MSEDLIRAHAEASVAYDLALMDYEDALASRDPARRATAEAALTEAARVLSGALAALVASRAQAVTFATLLNDPQQQLDPDGEVMRSVRAYQNATSATLSAEVPK